MGIVQKNEMYYDGILKRYLYKMPNIFKSRFILLAELRDEFDTYNEEFDSFNEKFDDYNEMTTLEMNCLDTDNFTIENVMEYVEDEYNNREFEEDECDRWCENLAEYKEWERYYNHNELSWCNDYCHTVQCAVYCLMKDTVRSVYLRELNELIKERKINIFIRRSPVIPDLTKTIISYL